MDVNHIEDILTVTGSPDLNDTILHEQSTGVNLGCLEHDGPLVVSANVVHHARALVEVNLIVSEVNALGSDAGREQLVVPFHPFKLVLEGEHGGPLVGLVLDLLRLCVVQVKFYEHILVGEGLIVSLIWVQLDPIVITQVLQLHRVELGGVLLDLVVLGQPPIRSGEAYSTLEVIHDLTDDTLFL